MLGSNSRSRQSLYTVRSQPCLLLLIIRGAWSSGAEGSLLWPVLCLFPPCLQNCASMTLVPLHCLFSRHIGFIAICDGKTHPIFFHHLHQWYLFLRIIQGLPINIQSSVPVDLNLCYIWLWLLFSKKISISFLPFRWRFTLVNIWSLYLQFLVAQIELDAKTRPGKLWGFI